MITRRQFATRLLCAAAAIPAVRLFAASDTALRGTFHCYLTDEELREMQPVLAETWGQFHATLTPEETDPYPAGTTVEAMSINELRGRLGLSKVRHYLADQPILERQPSS